MSRYAQEKPKSKAHIGEWVGAIAAVTSPAWIIWSLYAFGVIDPS